MCLPSDALLQRLPFYLGFFYLGHGVSLQGCSSKATPLQGAVAAWVREGQKELYAEYIMRNAGLDEAQAGIQIAGRNIYNLRYADHTTLMAESEEELKGLLMKVKEESEKVGLKLNIQKGKIMASGPITSWQIDGAAVSDFIFWAPKSLQMVTLAMKLKDACSLKRKL